MNVNNHKYIFIQCQSHRTLTFLFHRRLVSAVQANIRSYHRIGRFHPFTGHEGP